MYDPFPGNYVWNLSVNIALAMGGVMGEIDPANNRVREIAGQDEDQGTEAFFQAWGDLAERLVELAEEAEAAGHNLSASEKFLRATAYYITAERMQSRHYAPRQAMYRTLLETFRRAVQNGGLNAEHVEIPFAGKSFPAVFVRGHGAGPRPCMVFCNGLDSIKEMIFLVVRDEFAKRGISCLMVDQPGVGEALRLHGLAAIVDTERWAGAALDYLEGRANVDPARIGIMGWSLGGYYAPRAAAYEQRFALCVAWGANHDWGTTQARRMAREGDRPVPHYWDHVTWVWGHDDVDAFMRFVPMVTLEGHLDRIKVPFLVVHGENDRQIPLEDARRSYAAAINSPDRELKIFTPREGGIEHVSADNMEPVRSFVCDWVAERLGDRA